ncbi:MAG: efflux RND transporter periplasmic adaptor subunit, partial [Lysobacterales bacterium]
TTTVSLADLSSVWLQAEVFESQAGWVAAGQVAEARLDYLPGAVLTGQVDYVYPVLDPMMRTLKVRLRFDNPGERLKPNMYARVSIHGHEKPLALTIPREALIPTQDSNRVVLALGEGKFRVHEVVTGLESGEYVEVLAGVSEGDEIVTSAQFLIDSEASISGSIRRLETVAAPHQQHQSGQESVGEKDSQTDRERRRIMAGAVVRGVDRASNIVKLEHEPISALNWPAMTMNFEVDSSVALDTLREGQAIHFSMLEVDTNEWVIDQIHVMEADTDTDTGHEGHHHD